LRLKFGPTLGTVINCRQPARQGLDFIRHVFDSLIEMRPVADQVPTILTIRATPEAGASKGWTCMVAIDASAATNATKI
jgi:hypothetical protein